MDIVEVGFGISAPKDVIMAGGDIGLIKKWRSHPTLICQVSSGLARSFGYKNTHTAFNVSYRSYIPNFMSIGRMSAELLLVIRKSLQGI